jgi:tellurite resistance protein TerC
MSNPWGWVGFNAVVLTLLALDVVVLHRKSRPTSVKRALAYSIGWVVLSLSFAFGVYRVMGHQAGLEFLTGYLIEYALSVDNIFVFVLIFAYFEVPQRYQHRVLFWGIIGALVLRGAMILAGSELVARFSWVLYVFGAFLVFTGLRMALQKDESTYDPEKDPVFRLARKIIPVTRHFRDEAFFVKERDASGVFRRAATPLLIVLLVIDTTDVVFATDSIPAIFAVTRDPFIVYTSNICAVLGLRALYSVLAGAMDKFHYLKIGLAIVLMFIGVKMLVESYFPIPILMSLGVVAAILVAAVLSSLRWPKAHEKA